MSAAGGNMALRHDIETLPAAVLTALFGLLATSLAWSQSAPDRTAATAADSGALAEVVVTAQYRAEPLQQTPIAITAVTADDIEQRGFTNSSDIAYAVPNASFRPAQAAFGKTQTAYIRGVGQNDFNFAFEPGVGIYVDDVYYPTTMSSQFDLMDLDRVEVLRGPQGTLFGRGSIGGAVRYISKQPTGDNTGFIEGTVGDFHRVDLRAGYDFALIEDKLFARITGVSKKQDGYVDRIDFVCEYPQLSGSLPRLITNRDAGCKLGTLGGTDVNGARAQLRYVASDTLSFDLALDYQPTPRASRRGSTSSVTTSSNPFVVHVIDPAEARPKLHGDVLVYDCETGAEREVTVTARVLDRFAEAHARYLADIERFFCATH